MNSVPHPGDLGTATIAPDHAIAGAYGTWRFTYRAGTAGIESGGWIKIYTDSDSDWEMPQFLDPYGADYMTVTAPEGVRAAVRADNHKTLRILIQGRKLQPGEQIQLVLGDREKGGPGSRAQTFTEAKRFFWVDVKINGDGPVEVLPDPPHLSVIGDEIASLVVIAPSNVLVGQPFRLLMKAEDKWGNATAAYSGTVHLSGDGISFDSQNQRVCFSDQDRGSKWLEGFIAEREGQIQVDAADTAIGLQATSNPIVSTGDSPEFQLAWADPHGGQLVLNSKITDFFRHARDVAGVQFVGYQRNADVMSHEDWVIQQREEERYYEPGRFVPIPGFEWSGRTWQGGHHNIYFRRFGQPARRNEAAEEMFQAERAVTELPHIEDVYRAYRSSDVTITPHVGGEHSDLTHHEPTLEPAVEIVSSHGMFEWMLRDSLRRGYKLGFLGGSDSYTGRPGDDRPGHQLRRYSKAGLTGVYTRDVSLPSFHEAMQARRVFATTGARMILKLESDGHWMGSQYTTSRPPRIRASVVSTSAVQSVSLFRGLQQIHTVPIEKKTIPNQIQILWQGGSRMTSYSGIVWDVMASVRHAKITRVRTLRFDSPRSTILQQDDQTIRCQAWGCGYPMGLVVELTDAGPAEIDISLATKTITGPAYGEHGSKPPRRISFAPAERATMRIDVADLSKEPEVLDLGVLDRKLQVGLATQSNSATAELQFEDESPLPGINPYWIKVVQEDLETGWTSPVFVDYCPSPAS